MDSYDEARKKVYEATRLIAGEMSTTSPWSPSQAIVNLLSLALCDAIRERWYETAKNDPAIAALLQVAKTIVSAEHDYLGGTDPIVGLPGMQPQFTKINGEQCVFLENIFQIMHPVPFSALYVERLCWAQSYLEQVAPK